MAKIGTNFIGCTGIEAVELGETRFKVLLFGEKNNDGVDPHYAARATFDVLEQNGINPDGIYVTKKGDYALLLEHHNVHKFNDKFSAVDHYVEKEGLPQTFSRDLMPKLTPTYNLQNIDPKYTTDALIYKLDKIPFDPPKGIIADVKKYLGAAVENLAEKLGIER